MIQAPRRRGPGQDEPHPRSFGRFAVEIEAAAQTIGHDAVDDMQAEAGTALMTAGREEWIERLASDLRTHAATIIREQYLDLVRSGGAGLDVNPSLPSIRERMRNRIEEEMGQHLPVRSGITIHRKIRLALDVQGDAALWQGRPQTDNDLLSQIAEIE